MLVSTIVVFLVAYCIVAQDLSDAKVNQITRAIRRKREIINRIDTINQAFDAAVRPLQTLLQTFHMDPLHAPDQNISLLEGLGYCDILNIKVYNVSTIKRHSDMYLLEYVESRRLEIVIPLTFEQLLIIANYKAGSAPFLYATGSVIAVAKGSVIDVQLLFDYSTVTFNLTKFKIETLGDITTHFDENVLSFALNAASPLFIKVFEGVIQYIIEGPIANQIENLLNATNTEIKALAEKYEFSP